MAVTDVGEYLKFIPAVAESPEGSLWVTYDREADVLYVNFRKPVEATDTELTENDVIVRYKGGDIIGYTILHASKR